MLATLVHAALFSQQKRLPEGDIENKVYVSDGSVTKISGEFGGSLFTLLTAKCKATRITVPE